MGAQLGRELPCAKGQLIYQAAEEGCAIGGREAAQAWRFPARAGKYSIVLHEAFRGTIRVLHLVANRWHKRHHEMGSLLILRAVINDRLARESLEPFSGWFSRLNIGWAATQFDPDKGRG